MWIASPLRGTVADSSVLHGLANGTVTTRIIWHKARVNALVLNAGPIGGAFLIPLTANLNCGNGDGKLNMELKKSDLR